MMTIPNAAVSNVLKRLLYSVLVPDAVAKGELQSLRNPAGSDS